MAIKGLGLANGPFNSVNVTAQQRLHVHKEGKIPVNDTVWDMTFDIFVTPAQVADEVLREHLFALMPLKAGGGDQTTFEDAVGTDESKELKKLYACADGMTWRAQDGGQKVLKIENDKVVLKIDGQDVHPLHGITITSCTPDDDKRTNRPVGTLRVSVKGCDVEEHGSHRWREYTGENYASFEFITKNRAHFDAESERQKQYKAAAAQRHQEAKAEEEAKKKEAEAKKGGNGTTPATTPRGKKSELTIAKG